MWFRSLTKLLSSRNRKQRPFRRQPTRSTQLLLEALEDRAVPSALVSTDKPDYAPGETVQIQATGFKAGESVAFQVYDLTDSVVMQSWRVRDGGAGDLDHVVNGQIQTTWLVTVNASGDSLRLNATGVTSGLQATALFTDANPNLNDFANGPVGGSPPAQPWTNGNLNASKAHYVEDDSVPFEAVFTGLTVGQTYTLTISYDTTKGGMHAFDYLTSFDRTIPLPTSDPLIGVTDATPQSPTATSTIPIPIDPNVTAGGVTQIGGQVITLYGANGSQVTSAYSLSGTYAGDSTTSITITFTVVSSPVVPAGTVVVAWGAHVAAEADWGAGNGATGLSGSPYHVSISSSVGGGSQDHQIAASAISRKADLSITKTDNKTSVAAGTSDTYTIVVTNNGPSSVTGAKVVDNFPSIFTGVTYTAVATGGATGFTASGSGNINDTVNMPVGSTVTYTVTGTISPSATGSLVNTATVTAPTGITDPTPGNNSATDTDTIGGSADLSITKTDGKTSVIAGTTDTYTIVVTNNGPSAVTGAKVVDNFPAEFTGVTYTAVASGGATGFTASGSGNINDTVNMPVGSTITYTVTGTVDAAATGFLVNTATVTTPTGVNDPTPGNNSATDTDNIGITTDLAITKTDGKTTVVAGTTDTYTIVVTNNGLSPVFAAKVVDNFPSIFTGVTYTAVATGGATGFTAAGSGNINDTVDMPVGSTITYTVTGTISASATGQLVNTATVTLPSGVTDPTPGNNSATDTDDIGASADLCITKTDGKTSVTAGTTDTYTIFVTNFGPTAVTGAKVVDNFPSIFTGVTYTAVATGGASGFTASGSGDINDTVNLPVGSTITYTVTGTISASATGQLVNTATVTPPTGVSDPIQGNNSATDTDDIGVTADLSITKTDGKTSVTAGTTDTYTIVVTNNGLSPVTGAKVVDNFPSTFTGVTYTAVASGGATGFTASGSGDINDTVNMPVGSTITYTVTGTISASATGQLVNTATVTAPTGVSDPTPGNNSATDTDDIGITADLSITKTDGKTTVLAGASDIYTIVVTNNGPSAVTGAKVVDNFPSIFTGVTYTAVASGGATGFTASGSGNINDTVDLPVGSTITYTVTGTVSASATGLLVNTATVTAPTGANDPTPGNNSATDSDTITAPDLSITKTDGKTSAVPGTTTTYTIIVTNTGTATAVAQQVTDIFPASITNATWTAVASAGSSVAATSGTGNINTTVTVLAGGTVTFTVQATISPSATGTLVNTATVAVPVGDNTPANNTATDTDTLTPQADLAVTKTNGVTSVLPGSTVTYTITVTNNGPSTVNSFSLIDTLSSQLTNAVFGAPSAGTYNSTTGLWSGLNLATGQSVTIKVTATVSSTASGTITNSVHVSPPPGVTDLNPNNDSASDTDTVTQLSKRFALARK